MVSFKHILVSRTDKIGDLVLSLPVFSSLRASFPEARITALVSPYAREVVEGHPHVDQVELYDGKAGPIHLRGRFKALGCDAFLALYPRPALALGAWAAGIPTRVGSGFRWYSFAFNRQVKVHRSLCERHEADYNLDLVRAIGGEKIQDRILFPLEERHRVEAERLLKSKGVEPGDRFVAVHPGHRGSALNWSLPRYGEVLTKLIEERGVKVLITAGPGEEKLILRLLSILPRMASKRKPATLVNECGLKTLTAVYGKALCFLSGSTGTMHLAAAAGIPVVALFGTIPTTTPVRWGPRGDKTTVLMPENLECGDCKVGKCRRHDPMDAISVDKVLGAVGKHL